MGKASFLWILLVGSCWILAQSTDDDKSPYPGMKSLTLPIVPKTIKLAKNDYSQLLQTIEAVDMDVSLDLRIGKYKIVADKMDVSLEVPGRRTVTGKIYFRLDGIEENGEEILLTPKITWYRFVLDRPIHLIKSGVNLVLTEFGSYETGKITFHGKMFTSIARFFVKKLLRPEASLPEQDNSQILESMKIHNAQLSLQPGAKITRLGSTLLLGEQSKITISNFSLVQDQYVQSDFAVSLALAPGSDFHWREWQLVPRAGIFHLTGRARFSKNQFSYSLASEEQNLTTLVLENCSLSTEQDRNQRLFSQKMSLQFSQLHYSHDLDTGQIAGNGKLFVTLDSAHGSWIAREGLADVSGLSIPGIYLHYDSEDLRKRDFSCELVGTISLDKFSWYSHDYRDSLQVRGLQLATGAKTNNGWRDAAIDVAQLQLLPLPLRRAIAPTPELSNLHKMAGHIKRLDINSGEKSLTLREIQLKTLSFLREKDLRITGKAGLQLDLWQAPGQSWLRNAGIELRGINVNLFDHRYLDCSVGQLAIHLSQAQVVALLKRAFPDKIVLPAQPLPENVSEILRQGSWGAFRAAEIRDLYIDGIHSAKLSFLPDEIKLRIVPTLHMSLCFERQISNGWQWQKAISLKITVAIDGAVAFSVTDAQPVLEKKLQMHIACHDIDILDFPDTLETLFSQSGFSLREMMKRKINRTIDIDPFCKLDRAHPLGRLFIEGIHFIPEKNTVIFTASAISQYK